MWPGFLRERYIESLGFFPTIFLTSAFINIEDESLQITNLLQGYVENEVNLNKDGSCAGSCEDHKFGRNRHCSEGTFCGDQIVDDAKRHICSGTIVDCIFIESNMQICPSVIRIFESWPKFYTFHKKKRLVVSRVHVVLKLCEKSFYCWLSHVDRKERQPTWLDKIEFCIDLDKENRLEFFRSQNYFLGNIKIAHRL